MRLAESSTNENNTGEKTGDVERSPGLALVLDIELNTWHRSWSCYPGSFPYKKSRLIPFLFYLSGKWVMAALEIIKDVAGSKGELILYFKSKFWAWVDELRAGSVHRIVIYSLRPLSKLRRARLKLFCAGRKFVQVESRNLFSPFYKWIVRVRIWPVSYTHLRAHET